VPLPVSDPRNPRRMASEMVATGHFHDVVISANKLVRGAQLDERDTAALRWAQELLNVAAEPNAAFDMPPTSRLADVGATVIALKQAADAAEIADALSSIRDRLAAALRGERDQQVVSCMATLERLFSTISRIALQSEVQAKDEREANQTWASLTTTSHL
jgi:hypothetical protein